MKDHEISKNKVFCTGKKLKWVTSRKILEMLQPLIVIKVRDVKIDMTEF